MDQIGPGPFDVSLLRFQNSHISSSIWAQEERPIRPRHHLVWGPPEDQRVAELIQQTAFSRVMSIGQVQINAYLITALVERWRMETHTFHFPHGEATVTLADVHMQLGLPIDGDVVTGKTSASWDTICTHLLGASPFPNFVKGGSVSLAWLEAEFTDLPDDANDDVVAQHARAYIMRIIGGLLIPDTSGARVHLMYLLLLEDLLDTHRYSWGSAVLASLYRALDRATNPDQVEVGGCLLLLQSWTWHRIPCVAPQVNRLSDEEAQEGKGFPLARRWDGPMVTTNTPGHAAHVIRGMFDRLRIDEFNWMPYNDAETTRLFTDDVLPVPVVARAVVPLICFAIVEWHPADRVMRQFGLNQPIPDDPPNLDEVHKVDMRGKTNVDWSHRHRKWIAIWNNRNNRLIHGPPYTGLLPENSEYMQWYIQHTRRYISRDGCFAGRSYTLFHYLKRIIHSPSRRANMDQLINTVDRALNHMLNLQEEIYPSAFTTHYEEAPPTQHFAFPTESPPRAEQYEPPPPEPQDFSAYVPDAPPPPQPQDFSTYVPYFSPPQQPQDFSGYVPQFSPTPQAEDFLRYEPNYSPAPRLRGFEDYVPRSSFQQPGSSNIFASTSLEFAANYSTPPSAYHSPTLPDELRDMNVGDDANNNDDDNDGDNIDLNQQPQRRRGRRGGQEQVEQPRRVLPQRQRRRPHCGTSSHH